MIGIITVEIICWGGAYCLTAGSIIITFCQVSEETGILGRVFFYLRDCVFCCVARWMGCGLQTMQGLLYIRISDMLGLLPLMGLWLLSLSAMDSTVWSFSAVFLSVLTNMSTENVWPHLIVCAYLSGFFFFFFFPFPGSWFDTFYCFVFFGFLDTIVSLKWELAVEE
jgi:hypothetical protein